MEIYIAVRDFKDKNDNKYLYESGDIYPREGMKVDEKRIKELSTKKNKNKKIYIKKINIENGMTQEKTKQETKDIKEEIQEDIKTETNNIEEKQETNEENKENLKVEE